MRFPSRVNDFADMYGKDCTLSLCPIENDSQAGGILHAESALKKAGQELLLSWDFCTHECGVPPRARMPIANALLRLGVATFPFFGYSTEPFYAFPDTRSWLLKIPWSYRLRKLIFGSGGLGVGEIREICTSQADVLCEHQLDCWNERFVGFLVITREPLNEETWTWNEVRHFSPGVVDRDGLVSARRSVALVIPGYDTDYLWIWCVHESVPLLQQALREACDRANLQFRMESTNEMS